MKTHTMADIDDFLSRKRLAIVGVSRKQHHFSRAMMREFVHRGYDVVPVNPATESIDDLRCAGRVAAIMPPPEAALIMTPENQSLGAVTDCLQSGVPRIWLYAKATGSVAQKSLDLCQASGATLIAGECPFMFFPNPGVIHGIHRFVCRITGALPR